MGGGGGGVARGTPQEAPAAVGGTGSPQLRGRKADGELRHSGRTAAAAPGMDGKLPAGCAVRADFVRGQSDMNPPDGGR